MNATDIARWDLIVASILQDYDFLLEHGPDDAFDRMLLIMTKGKSVSPEIRTAMREDLQERGPAAIVAHLHRKLAAAEPQRRRHWKYEMKRWKKMLRLSAQECLDAEIRASWGGNHDEAPPCR